MSSGQRRSSRILCVVGARPNFVKMAPVVRELRARAEHFDVTLAHTGQHYDEAMSAIFLDELGVGRPDVMLEVGPGSHARQTARVMEGLEPVFAQYAPDLALVAGDVNSTLAAALVAAKLGVTLGHVEAGLRSFDRSMPEEINRVLTDQLSDLLFVHSPEAIGHLRREGLGDRSIHAVGNTMIDSLVAMRARIRAADTASQLGLTPAGYLVVTLHRPALVDGPLLPLAVEMLERVGGELPVVFPCHPRTRARFEQEGLAVDPARVRLLEPLGYIEFLSLVERAGAVLTDSGGIQEETTYLGVPCFTLRDNTERPITCSAGTNELIGLCPEAIAEVPRRLSARTPRELDPPAGWDGKAAGRLVDVLELALPERRQRLHRRA